MSGVALCARCLLDYPAGHLLEDGLCYGCSVNAGRERLARLREGGGAGWE